jgi:hypothetical protein
MIGPICLWGGWLGIAWGLSKTNFIQAPQGQNLTGYERFVMSLCWPVFLVVIFGVIAVALAIMVIGRMKGRE